MNARMLAVRLGLDGNLSALRRRLVPAESRHPIHALVGVLVADGFNCVDVGAHRGYYLERFLQRSPSGRHVAFEPVPALAERLVRRFPAAEIHHAAVSDHAGTADFTVALSRPAVSCLVERPRTMRERTQRIQVPLCTLDGVLGERDVQLVKIDVEGAQQQVLEGGYETIARCQPVVIFEHGRAAREHFGADEATIYELLVEEAGLRLSTVQHPSIPLDLDRFRRAVDEHLSSDFVAMPTLAARRRARVAVPAAVVA
jgi:FkbM family methyltransferase